MSDAKKPDRRIPRIGALVTVLAAGALLVAASTAFPNSIVQAQNVNLGPRGEWEHLPLPNPVGRIFTPATGALFVAASPLEPPNEPDGEDSEDESPWLLRSDDAGMTWTRVNLPPNARQVWVASSNQEVIYIIASDGELFRTTDGTATWHLMSARQGVFHAFAVSPVDPDLLYLVAVIPPYGAGTKTLLRSRDGGASWERVGPPTDSDCSITPVPHASDARRLFYWRRCGRTARGAGNLAEVAVPGLGPGAGWHRPLAGPNHLVGGAGAAPSRYYLAADQVADHPTQWLLRSDDDGRHWTEMWSTEIPRRRITGLAYDPMQPDRVFFSVGEQQFGTVNASSDGGLTWAALGPRDLGDIREIALGIDGRNLYAATRDGLWRFRFAE